MTERLAGEQSGDYFEPSEHGSTEADGRHLTAAEAEAALDVGERPEELPEADDRFDGPGGHEATSTA